MGLGALASKGHSEPVAQEPGAEPRPRLGQKEPAGQGLQLSSETPPRERGFHTGESALDRLPAKPTVVCQASTMVSVKRQGQGLPQGTACILQAESCIEQACPWCGAWTRIHPGSLKELD